MTRWFDPSLQNITIGDGNTTFDGSETTLISQGGAVREIALTTLVSSSSAGSANPLMDGVAAPGNSTLYSRQDHVHPVDTSRMPLTPSFTSSEQAIAVNTDNSVAHGLGRLPILFSAHLRCKTAELGYSVGDEILYSDGRGFDGITSRGSNVYANTTNVGFVLLDIPAIFKRTATIGTLTVITAANWKMVLYAW